MELDRHASEQNAPYLIYTSDCSDPKEIDDGVFVERLPLAGQAYRVGVCVADTSKLYLDGTVRQQVIERVHAEYWDLPGGERAYAPMIDPEAIKELELREGKVRSALIISFMVGQEVDPQDVKIEFGRVEVVKNLTYKESSELSVVGERNEDVANAASHISKMLRFTEGGDSDKKTGGGPLHLGPRQKTEYASWKHGSKMNEAFMVAANHLVGKVMAEEDLPAIYRVHDLSDLTHGEILDASCARYTRLPGKHQGLNVGPYCRVTSPLRRLEDFVMSHHLRQRASGQAVSKGDIGVMDRAIRELNRRAIYESVRPSVARARAHSDMERDHLRLVS